MPRRRSGDDENAKEDKINSLIASYLVRRDEGESIDREKILKEHPDEAQALLEFFDDDDFMNDLGKSVQ